MKNILALLFKKEPEIDYVIAEYQPIKIDKTHIQVNVTEYDYSQLVETDDMQIDKIYQRN